MTQLRITALCKNFGGVAALQDVSFDVAQGEILGLMGANGAGKTTLFSLIAGHANPNSGTIELEGQRIEGLAPERVNRLGIARTFQIVRPFADMSVLENVATAALFGAGRTARPSAAEEEARAILEEVGLADRQSLPAAALTLAERKRLEVARALATLPKILLLDEVLAGLTATEVAAALEMLKGIKENRQLTFIMVEHVMRALMRLSDRLVVLHQGARSRKARRRRLPIILRSSRLILEAAMNPLLDIADLQAGYGEVRVLKGISLQVEAETIAAVIGSNGAGKTTLMRAIAGLLPVTAGRARFAGEPITDWPASRRVELGMALVPEGRLVFPDFTVEETLRIGAFTARRGWSARADALLDLFPRLRERWKTRAGVLSGGEQQMLALARGLMSEPRLLLLDEPSLGLSPAMATQIFDLIARIRQTGVTVCLVEQDVRRTLELADHAVVMENGEVTAAGPGESLLQSDRIKESYLGLSR